MAKKLTKHGNSLALIIDKPILEILGINDTTDLEVVVTGDALIIKPKKRNLDAQKKREESISKTAHDIMDKYKSVFEKLAKT
jgi:antitoxin component of MazEF toxin-antitoxin module